MTGTSSNVHARLQAEFDQACLLFRLGHVARAQTAYEGILTAHPRHAGSLHHLGLISARASDYQRAIELLGKAAKADPHNACVHYDRARALYLAGQFESSLTCYNRAIAIRPGYAEAHLGRGNALRALGNLEAALASHDEAIALRRDYAEAHSNRGVVLRELNRLDSALESFARALAIREDAAETHFNRGIVLSELGELDAAVRSYDRAIALKPDAAETYCHRAMALLIQGRLEAGWRDYEWRWKNRGWSTFRDRRALPAPLWLGEQGLAGKTILLFGEQGLGDTLQFCRYAELVAQLGADVILEVQRPLVSLLAGLGNARVIARGAALPHFDYQCPLLSMPLAFRTRLETIPSRGRYLRADADNVARWRVRLGKKTRPFIGLVWSGSATHRSDRNRSVQLAELLRYLPPGPQYVSLQKEVRANDSDALRSNPAILDVADQLNDFGDTAALCDCLDLVISVDTGVAHLSAALGKTTWIMLPFAPDWRWLLNRSDSPWYATATLFRQARPGDWSTVFEQVAACLAATVRGMSEGIGRDA